jgi:uncharacterized protein (TIGR02145 family)
MKEVKIGNQIWMVENLNIDKFRNGDLIDEAQSLEEWVNAGSEKKPAWCYYKNKNKNGEKYGKLYNWYAVIDKRGLAPEGWHIPSAEEWWRLIGLLGGSKEAAKKMKCDTGWLNNGNNNPYLIGTNESGFSALPAGCRDYLGYFKDNGIYCEWWSNTEYDSENVRSRPLFIHNGELTSYSGYKERGLAIRCLKD